MKPNVMKTAATNKSIEDSLTHVEESTEKRSLGVRNTFAEHIFSPTTWRIAIWLLCARGASRLSEMLMRLVLLPGLVVMLKVIPRHGFSLQTIVLVRLGLPQTALFVAQQFVGVKSASVYSLSTAQKNTTVVCSVKYKARLARREGCCTDHRKIQKIFFKSN